MRIAGAGDLESAGKASKPEATEARAVGLHGTHRLQCAHVDPGAHAQACGLCVLCRWRRQSHATQRESGTGREYVSEA